MKHLLVTLLGGAFCSLLCLSCTSNGAGRSESSANEGDSVATPSQFVSSYKYPEGSPVALHGALHVDGIQLCDSHNQPVQLAGFSTMGWQWCADCYTRESLKNLVDNWHINILRLAMYVEEGGYNDHPEPSRKMMCELVDMCAELGIYCIVDWHILTPGNPEDPVYHDAIPFFQFMSRKYAGAPHVIFEICNEPNGPDTKWENVSHYAYKVIPVIHAAYDSIGAPHPIIICGTPQWDQLVDAPLVEGRYQGNGLDFVDLPEHDTRLKFDNIMYTFHFYAASHNQGSPKDGINDYYNYYKYMYKVLGKLPVFCSEYGVTEASGAGKMDFDHTDEWLLMFMGNNAGHQKVSFCNWSYSDKDEQSAALQPLSCRKGQWDNATASGDYVRRVLNVVNNGAQDTSVLKPSNLYKP